MIYPPHITYKSCDKILFISLALLLCFVIIPQSEAEVVDQRVRVIHKSGLTNIGSIADVNESLFVVYDHHSAQYSQIPYNNVGVLSINQGTRSYVKKGIVYGALSGSIGTGPGQINPRKAYAQGKSLTFKVLACKTCPIQASELDRDRAMSLAASLEALYADEETGSPDDDVVYSLCSSEVEDCGIRLEVVHYFLTRRYRLQTPVRGIQNEVIDEN